MPRVSSIAAVALAVYSCVVKFTEAQEAKQCNQPEWVPNGCYAIADDVIPVQDKIYHFDDHLDTKLPEMATAETYSYLMAFKWKKSLMNDGEWGNLFYRHFNGKCGSSKYCHRHPALFINSKKHQLHFAVSFKNSYQQVLDLTSYRLEEGRWMYAIVSVERVQYKVYRLEIDLDGEKASREIKADLSRGGKTTLFSGMYKGKNADAAKATASKRLSGAEIARFAYCPYILSEKERQDYRENAREGLFNGFTRYLPTCACDEALEKAAKTL